MAQNISPDDLLHRMLLLHIAYHNIENCLLRLKRILVFNADISSKLQSYFTEEISIVRELSHYLCTCISTKNVFYVYY